MLVLFVAIWVGDTLPPADPPLGDYGSTWVLSAAVTLPAAGSSWSPADSRLYHTVCTGYELRGNSSCSRWWDTLYLVDDIKLFVVLLV